MKFSIKSITATALLMASVTFTAPVAASDYPNRPIRLIAPYAAGGLSDILARALAQELSQKLGQSVVVENRTGAGGIIGTDSVARSQPDGYTIGIVGQGLASVNTTLYKNLPYDTLKDFDPLSMIAKFSIVLVTEPEKPYKSVKDFVEAGKTRNDMNYGSAGNASTAHLAMEMFKEQTGMDIMHVPYKGESQAFTELLGGRIDGTFGTVGGALALIEAGKLRPLAVADTVRNPLLPDVPTFAEAGFPDVNVFGWYAVLAPAGIPEDAAARLSEALVAIGNDEGFKKTLQARGMEAVGTKPEEAIQLIKDEEKRWAEIIEKAGIKVD